MKFFKGFAKSTFSLLLCAAMVFSLLAQSAFAQTDIPTDTQTGFGTSGTDGSSTDTNIGTEIDVPRYHAAYSFNDANNLVRDEGGVYPLLDKTFGSAAISSVKGCHNSNGMRGFVEVDPRLFNVFDEYTFGFWVNFSLQEARAQDKIFYAVGENGSMVDVSMSLQEDLCLLTLTVSDGVNPAAVCSYDVTSLLSDTPNWFHVVFTYQRSGASSRLTLYVNGNVGPASISAQTLDLTLLKVKNATIWNVTLDDLYITNSLLSLEKIQLLKTLPVSVFFANEENEMNGTAGSTILNYKWAGYTFDTSISCGADLNNSALPAAFNPTTVSRINPTKPLRGYAMSRRENAAPEAYLTFDSRLFFGQPEFTFACYVYRTGSRRADNEILLDLNGNGSLRFAPYGTQAYLEYTGADGVAQRTVIGDGNIANVASRWVHFALTVSASGVMTVYVDGVAKGTVETGLSMLEFMFSDNYLLTGASSEDSLYTYIDEVYVSPVALSDAEIRKLNYYGIEKYTTDPFLQDPAGGSDVPGPDNPSVTPGPGPGTDAVDKIEDAYQETGTIRNDFIGTTFDNSSFIGKDWNSGAVATLTGGVLSAGVHSFGLSLDGVDDFVRYPKGIFDGADQLTISLSYNWKGSSAGINRSQRIFDFSRKTSSAAAPLAGIYLETGIGNSGLRFGISDGVQNTYLDCYYNATDTWTRITVTVKDGIITLYINDELKATCSTLVDVASICPNYNYLGRSSIKGDPLFCGVIDEVYLSTRALTSDRVGAFVGGIAAAVDTNDTQTVDFWDIFVDIVMILAIVLLVVLLLSVILIAVKREKIPKVKENFSVLVPERKRGRGKKSDPPAAEPELHSARRIKDAEQEVSVPVDDAESTMKFKKVGEASEQPKQAPSAKDGKTER